MLQICLTRVLSVMAYFHLSFFCISMAMLGMTAGALWTYLRRIGETDYAALLPRYTLYYAVAAMLVPLLLVTTYLPMNVGLTTLLAVIKTSVLLAIPFFFAGIVVALCLTRAGDMGSINMRYGFDLVGAAFGCLLSIPLLNLVNGPAALVVAGLLGVLASMMFTRALSNQAKATRNYWQRLNTTAFTAGAFVLILLAGTAIHIPSTKTPELAVMGSEYSRWNSFSRVSVTYADTFSPFYWGASKDAPSHPIEQRHLTIDELAGTPFYKYDPTPGAYAFLDYDITSLAFQMRRAGDAAVIGIGGGRDAIAARHYGFSSVTVVELNPIIIDLLTVTEPYASFAGLKFDPAISFHVDDGRSWFARTQQKFDLIQMSLVDTMAATGAGAFTLSENNLYTVEGWGHFLRALKPGGVLTVSRYYSPSNLDETAKLYALSLSALIRAGVSDPASHIYIAGAKNIASLVISTQPLSADDLARMDGWVDQRGFRILARPGSAAITPVLQELSEAGSEAELKAISDKQILDISAPTDARPFFFNQLRLSSLFDLNQAYDHEYDAGVQTGNLRAAYTLLFLIGLSLLAVIAVLLVPAWSAVRGVDRSLARAGTSYFLLIGLGFMLVEIALIQRLSVFLGHPIYGMAIALFSLILLTGIGSFVGERLKIDRSPATLLAYAIVTCVVITLLALVAPSWLHAFEDQNLLSRATLAVLTAGIPALLMGMAMPAGMRLTERWDTTPTPWFWAVNGAAGVMASGLAIMISMNFGIPTTMMSGAACYLLLALPALRLYRRA
jgi:SAM-dependent methyltransferase